MKAWFAHAVRLMWHQWQLPCRTPHPSSQVFLSFLMMKMQKAQPSKVPAWNHIHPPIQHALLDDGNVLLADVLDGVMDSMNALTLQMSLVVIHLQHKPLKDKHQHHLLVAVVMTNLHVWTILSFVMCSVVMARRTVLRETMKKAAIAMKAIFRVTIYGVCPTTGSVTGFRTVLITLMKRTVSLPNQNVAQMTKAPIHAPIVTFKLAFVMVYLSAQEEKMRTL